MDGITTIRHGVILTLSGLLLCLVVHGQKASGQISIHDLHIRDPYILTDPETHTYLLYQSATVKNVAGQNTSGVVAYRSTDLESWTGPTVVYRTPENNWTQGAAWAPEVHQYKGKYYLFVTLSSPVEWEKAQEGWPKYVHRGTQICYADQPMGPFLPFKDHLPQTPLDWMALDGTFWVENGIPYMVFCHEWVQIVDGAIAVERLTPDLSKAASAPVTLFHGSAAPWSSGDRHSQGPASYVTDGCFLYRTKSGKLLLLWSSFRSGKYVTGLAESVTGKVTGPWKQQPQLLFDENGGHGMLFKALDGKLLLVLHAPNAPAGKERAHIFEVKDTGSSLKLGKKLF